MIVPSETRSTLGYGAFFGRFLRQQQVSGFSFSAMTPLLPPAEVETHTHENAHFVLVMGGLYISQARHAPLVAKAPFLVYNPPGTRHRDRFHTLDGSFLTISVSPDRLRSVAENVPLTEQAVVLRSRQATALAGRVARELTRWQPISALIVEALSLELLAEVAGQPLCWKDRIPPAWLSRARDLIREQCSDRNTVGEVAAAVDIHPVHLARSFRKFFQATPGEYLRACRVEKAAALLSETRMPLSAIALESGFADQSHFSKAFARSFGSSPREYRRRFGKMFACDQDVSSRQDGYLG